MKRITVWMTACAAAFAFAGCARISTRVVEKPRVDQEVQGNRGYLKGSAPAGGPRSATRQMLETNIELPTAEEMNPWRKHPKKEPAPAVKAAPVPPQDWQPPQEEEIQPAVESPESESVSAPVGGTTVVVRKGDTLQKIAQKVYGSSKKWYRIYKANQETLKSPDRLRPGQKLVIPPLEESSDKPHHPSRHREEYK